MTGFRFQVSEEGEMLAVPKSQLMSQELGGAVNIFDEEIEPIPTLN
ncbi:hypothetical protein L8106_03102 [Lyngbya sp. PCC 8106]|nr:hypothetical protein L8106_03102 [Lyngbya sp. PCC 8106]